MYKFIYFSCMCISCWIDAKVLQLIDRYLLSTLLNYISLNQFLHLCVVFALIMCQTREIPILLVNRGHSYECYINLVKITKRDKMQREKIQWLRMYYTYRGLKSQSENISPHCNSEIRAEEVQFLERTFSAGAELLWVHVLLGKITNSFKIWEYK